MKGYSKTNIGTKQGGTAFNSPSYEVKTKPPLMTPTDFKKSLILEKIQNY